MLKTNKIALNCQHSLLYPRMESLTFWRICTVFVLTSITVFIHIQFCTNMFTSCKRNNHFLTYNGLEQLSKLGYDVQLFLFCLLALFSHVKSFNGQTSDYKTKVFVDFLFWIFFKTRINSLIYFIGTNAPTGTIILITQYTTSLWKWNLSNSVKMSCSLKSPFKRADVFSMYK